jgi:hypothetical protein
LKSKIKLENGGGWNGMRVGSLSEQQKLVRESYMETRIILWCGNLS